MTARRTALAGVTALLLAAALLLGSERARAEEPAESLDCVIEPSMLVSIGSQADGVLENVLVNRGEVVERGQLLATLDDELERAAEALYRARAETDVSIRWSGVKAGFGARSAERLRKLGAASAASAQEVDEAVTDERLARLKNEEAKVNRRLAKLEHRRAEAALGQREISSPVRAVVVERLMHPGERVTDEPIMTIAAIDLLHVEVIAPINMFGKVQVGTRATVSPEAPVGGEYDATVTVVDKVMDARSGTFGVRLALPNNDHKLPAGLRCKISFKLDEPPVQANASPTAESTTTAELPSPATEPQFVKPTLDGAVASNNAARERVEDAASIESQPSPSTEMVDEEPGIDVVRMDVDSGATESLARKILSSAIPSASAAAAQQAPSRPTPSAAATPIVSTPSNDAPRAEHSSACVEFGPFNDARQASSVARLMRESGSEGVMRETVTGTIKGYLLLMPIKGSAKAAVANLARKGIHDVQVMRRGPHVGHISLGYHTELERAKKQQKTLASRGIDVTVTERRSGKTRYWLGFDAPRTDSRDTLAKRLLALEPDTTMRDVACIRLRHAAL